MECCTSIMDMHRGIELYKRYIGVPGWEGKRNKIMYERMGMSVTAKGVVLSDSMGEVWCS